MTPIARFRQHLRVARRAVALAERHPEDPPPLAPETYRVLVTSDEQTQRFWMPVGDVATVLRGEAVRLGSCWWASEALDNLADWFESSWTRQVGAGMASVPPAPEASP